jgi:type IV pilus assembly protein PilA
MFQRLHEKRQDEGGFTLIELLVVILIIAILAAIAIPVFLKQREKGWAAQVESALKNAATAEESYLAGSATNVYTTAETDLATEGFKKATDVTALTITMDAGKWYCVTAGHANLTGTWTYTTNPASANAGKPVKGGTCA